jgi:ABC-type bacteriocin/lantibiotic exporter with double-glycine peptidase domain
MPAKGARKIHSNGSRAWPAPTRKIMNISADNPREARARVALLAPAWGFLRPYWPRVLGASLALVFTASVTLSLGQGLRMLVDQGFVSGSAEQLNRAVLVFMLIVLLLAIGTFTRFYLVSWIGERVTADLRRAVFDHVLRCIRASSRPTARARSCRGSPPTPRCCRSWSAPRSRSRCATC